MKLNRRELMGAAGTLGVLAAVVGAALGQECPLHIGDPKVFAVARLHGLPQQVSLRELLISDFPQERYNFDESVFYYEDRLRPALLGLVQDPEAGDAAGWFLTLIGVPQDVRLIIQSPPKAKRPAFRHRWAYSVACALLDPSSEEEWSFLRSCALNEYGDRWVDAGAIQTLKLIASPRSRRILEEAQKQNPSRMHSVSKALEYIDSEPAPLVASTLVALAERVAQAVKIGEWQGNGKPRCNETMDKAVVDITFETGTDCFIHTATFHKIEGTWKLRGVRETMQMMKATPVPLLQPRGRRF